MAVQVQPDYKVQLDVFEGPLDLLLYLIKRDELDIHNIPISSITAQYMEYLSLMKMLDLNIAGEFLVMAATLMMIKSRLLLPDDQLEEMDDEDEGDPRWDLVRQLVEYKKFKDAAQHLEDLEMRQEEIFRSGSEEIVIEEDGRAVEDVSLFDLIAAFNEALKRARPEVLGEIIEDHYTVADKIELVLSRVQKGEDVRFTDLFPAQAYRTEIVCTFLALLELIRLRQVDVRQSVVFGEIWVIGIAGTAPALTGGAIAMAEAGI